MKPTVFIISGGVIDDPRIIMREVQTVDSPVLICADGAIRFLHILDLVPDVIIGDMDSADDKMLRYFEAKGSILIRHPKDKDETDTQLALEHALALKPRAIRIFGALGGRIDHALANISLLVLGARRGVETKIIDERCEVVVVARRHVIHGAPGQTVSCLPVSTTVSGITLEGFQYPLTDGTMEIGIPYGISNRLIGSQGVITVKHGYLLVVRYFREEE